MSLSKTNATIPRGEDLIDNNENCEAWSFLGECQANPKYMLLKGQKSCQTSHETPTTISSSTKTVSSLATIDQSNPVNQKCFTVATNIFNESSDDNKSRCFKSERYEDRSDSNVTSHIIEKLIFFILFDRESFTITN